MLVVLTVVLLVLVFLLVLMLTVKSHIQPDTDVGGVGSAGGCSFCGFDADSGNAKETDNDGNLNQKLKFQES